ncbi:MAG: hypothetical protein CMP59_10720 [Flavobacteriales bacterium]|mgnify:CR=1 FL=1|nr:hypothetical protein [Flavobacteriales bacterium]
MIIYSVTVAIDESVHDDWLKWMKEDHIPKVMDTGHFQDFRMLKLISHQTEEETVSYNIQYECESMAELHKYQVNKAPALQKEHSERYDGKFAAFRTLLEKV